MKGALFVFLGTCSYGILPIIVVLAYIAGFSLNDVVGSQVMVGAILLWLITRYTYDMAAGCRHYHHLIRCYSFRESINKMQAN